MPEHAQDERESTPSAQRWIKSLLLTGIVGVGAALLEKSSRASEAMYVLKSMVFAALELLSSHAWMFAVANGAGALLLLTVREEDAKPVRHFFSVLVLQLNRSAGHLEALFAWFTLVIWWAPALWLQVLGMFIVAVLGPLVMDALVYGRAGRFPRLRPLVPAVFTLVSVVGVLATDWAQWRQAAPLVLAVLAGLVPRTAWSLWRERPFHATESDAQSWTLFLDRTLMVAALGALVMAPLRALGPGHKASLENRVHRTLHWRSCGAEPSEPPGFSLYIVADNQLHALDGKRSGFHMDSVDSEVPVSVRPVELDLLSGVTFRAFGNLYQTLRRDQPDLRWVHLGDGADLGCASELDRFLTLARGFGLDGLAAVIPGNHDGAFLGNLSWHPDWDAACPGGRSSRGHARERLATLMSARKGRLVSPGGNFLATVTPLGELGADEVIGVFLDTTDVPRDAIGIAGAQGGISDGQVRWVQKTLGDFPKGRVLVFGHHPLDQWTKLSRKHLDVLATTLGKRLWAVVSAHTHLAARRTQKLGGREVPEFIAPSTIDPPQEAALLLGWQDGTLALRTLPAVGRAGMTCPEGPSSAVTAHMCQQTFEVLRHRPACAALFSGDEGDGGTPEGTSRTCAAKENHRGPILESGLGHVSSPEELDCLQEARAHELLECLGIPAAGPTPLHDPELPARVLAASAKDPTAKICLSWAAAVLQAHKSAHWGYAQAIDFCLDPSATYGELVARWPD